MRVALHTRLRPDRATEGRRARPVIPRDLEIALRDAGVSSWAIFRDGLDLFHVLEVADYQAMRHALRDDPANVPWQRRMSELLAAVDDLPGHDRGLKLVWELT